MPSAAGILPFTATRSAGQKPSRALSALVSNTFLNKKSLTSSHKLPPMKPTFLRIALTAGLLACPSGFAAQPQILLEESFTNGNRTAQQLPSSAAWFVSEADGVLQNKRGLSSAPNRHLLAYIAEIDKPISLSVGESLVMQLSFSAREPLAKGGVFRIGFFNSGGKRIDGDGAGASNPAFLGYRGYSAHLDFNSPKAISFHRRSEGISDKLISGNEAFGEPLARSTGTGSQLQSDSIYTLNFKLTRTASGITLSCDIPEFDGYSASFDETHQPLTTFDTIAIYGARSGMSRFTLDRIKIEK